MSSLCHQLITFIIPDKGAPCNLLLRQYSASLGDPGLVKSGVGEVGVEYLVGLVFWVGWYSKKGREDETPRLVYATWLRNCGLVHARMYTRVM